MISKRVDKWFTKFKLYFFTYKNGFFELPYLANTPELMIQSISKMPFNKQIKKKNLITSKTPFLKADIYYQIINSEMMLIVTQIEYKANVNYKMIYDKNLPKNWYFLTYQINEKPNLGPALVINGLNFTDKSWTLFKPGTDVANHHFKGEKSILMSLYFTEKALSNDFLLNPYQNYHNLNLFLDAKLNYLLCHKSTNQPEFNYQSLFEIIQEDSEKIDQTKLNQLVFDFFDSFNQLLNENKLTKKYFEIGNLERIKILKAEKILRQNIYKKFPKISFIANEVGLSETNLKLIFKYVKNETLFKFYQNLQMEEAKKLILSQNLKIKDVAFAIGYQNVSKFSIAYKKHFGVSPSLEMQ